ncbi:MAG: hypothetical protein DSY43_03480 [Gammaproteobacteria bacterium]|nr:MAG: hypothetical protein DSY43_03480 [Gammaproteobacteria bacterium]
MADRRAESSLNNNVDIISEGNTCVSMYSTTHLSFTKKNQFMWKGSIDELIAFFEGVLEVDFSIQQKEGSTRLKAEKITLTHYTTTGTLLIQGADMVVKETRSKLFTLLQDSYMENSVNVELNQDDGNDSSTQGPQAESLRHALIDEVNPSPGPRYNRCEETEDSRIDDNEEKTVSEAESDNDHEEDDEFSQLKDEMSILKNEVCSIKRIISKQETDRDLLGDFKACQNENASLKEITNKQKNEILNLKSENESLINVIRLLSINAHSLIPNVNLDHSGPRPFPHSFVPGTNPIVGDTVDLTNDCKSNEISDNANANNKHKSKEKKKKNANTTNTNGTTSSRTVATNTQTTNQHTVPARNRYEVLHDTQENNSQNAKKQRSTSSRNTTVQGKLNVVIAGDSIVKYVKGWELSNHSQRVTVKSFAGASVEDMSDFVKPLLRKQPDKIVLHIGTNDLRSSEPQTIADSITDLAHEIELQSPDTSIAISGIITRTDISDLTPRVSETNRILRSFCNQNGWEFAPNSNIKASHLNQKGLHLNPSGSAALQRNFNFLINN